MAQYNVQSVLKIFINDIQRLGCSHTIQIVPTCPNPHAYNQTPLELSFYFKSHGTKAAFIIK